MKRNGGKTAGMKEKILEKPKSFFMFVTILIIWTIFAVTFLSSLKGSFFLIIIPAIVIILLVLLLFRGDKKYRKLLDLLHEHCMPTAYIIEARNLLRLEQEKKRPKNEDALRLYLSDGLYAAGKFEKAMKTLEDINISRHRENAGFSSDYYHRRFLISLGMEKEDTAWDSLAKMRETVTYIKNRSKRELNTKMYNEDIHIFNAVKGDYKGAEETFREMLERGQTNYERSFASYQLGGVYKHLKKEAEAEDAYKYVLAWGNKLYIAGRSAEILGLNGWEA
jgi:tetratricopeptide (TPR) repeat protein